jgi:hypothetical protein
MLVKELLDLLIFRKPAFARGLESTIDATQFGRRCDVPTSVKLRVNLQRRLRQLDLSRLGPSLHALQNVLEFLCGHHECIARSFRSSDAPIGCRAKFAELPLTRRIAPVRAPQQSRPSRSHQERKRAPSCSDVEGRPPTAPHLGKRKRGLWSDIAMQRGAPQFVVIAPASRNFFPFVFAEQSRTARASQAHWMW